jgi:hypothetical protein
MMMICYKKLEVKRPTKTTTTKLSCICHVNKIMNFKIIGKTTSDGGFNWPAEEGQAV